MNNYRARAHIFMVQVVLLFTVNHTLRIQRERERDEFLGYSGDAMRNALAGCTRVHIPIRELN